MQVALFGSGDFNATYPLLNGDYERLRKHLFTLRLRRIERELREEGYDYELANYLAFQQIRHEQEQAVR